MDAWELVMRALSHYSRITPQDHVTVREYLDQAIAHSEIEPALKLNPSFSHAQNYYATALAFAGRWHDAIAAVKRALRLSPRDPLLVFNYGSAALAHYLGGNYNEAVRQAQTAIRLCADYASAHRVLVTAAAQPSIGLVAAAATRPCRLWTPAGNQLRRLIPNGCSNVSRAS